MPIPKAELMRRLRDRRRAEKLAAMLARACKACGKPLPATARAHIRTCSARCRARLSRVEGQRTQLNADEARRLHAALKSWMASVPDGGHRELVADGNAKTISGHEFHQSVRFLVTKHRDEFRIEAKIGWKQLALAVGPDGDTYRPRRAARLERLLFQAAARLPAESSDTTPHTDDELAMIGQVIAQFAAKAQVSMTLGSVALRARLTGLASAAREFGLYTVEVFLHDGLVLSQSGRVDGSRTDPPYRCSREHERAVYQALVKPCHEAAEKGR
jgi:hypothetical protein